MSHKSYLFLKIKVWAWYFSYHMLYFKDNGKMLYFKDNGNIYLRDKLRIKYKKIVLEIFIRICLIFFIK